MLFKKPESMLPGLYPHLLGYKDAIRHSYWIHTEFSMTEDIGDYHSKLSDVEKDTITRTMLAIAQVEVAVKAFWGELYKRMPHIEIQAVGATFSESEVRHFDAYKFLLEKLNLQHLFEGVMDIPELNDRVNYLTKYLDGMRSSDNKKFAKTLILFSLFIENVSLFSQFLIIMSFNKHKNLLKGMSNVVESTSKEEEIHGNFGAAVVNILRKEYPEFFNKEFDDIIYKACDKAFKAEKKVIDWIYKDGELEFLPKEILYEFIKNRFNNSLEGVGLKKLYQVNEELLDETEWFDVELSTKKEGDFFVKKQIDYSKKTKSFTANDLF